MQYKKKGMAGGAVGSIVGLIVGVGIATLVLIFVGTLSGKVYSKTEADITAITNETVRTHIQDAVVSGFESLDDTGSYMPIIVLAVVIALVLSIVLGLGAIGGGQGGSAL